MFGLSGEHLLILAGILLIFGPRKLPELGASVGRAFRNFKEGLNGPTSSGQLESHDAPVAQTKPVSAAEKPANPQI
ncbi:MAG: twin-arginine translocase TatA/TatE family subunit [Deltaproteobacteria bacterium]|nr:twin-arginine translocase TatA/TatE family subunit [Deltaproteobacteria bacterium]